VPLDCDVPAVSCLPESEPPVTVDPIVSVGGGTAGETMPSVVGGPAPATDPAPEAPETSG
jgi:hypothetical protein